MTLLGSIQSPNAFTAQNLFGLPNPPAGAQSVSLTFIGTTQTNVAAVTVTGSARDATAFRAPSMNASDSGNASGALTIVGTGSLALACVGNDQHVNPVAVAWSGASPGTERWNFVDGAPYQVVAGQTSAATGTINFAWTNNNTDTTAWGLIAVEILIPGVPYNPWPQLAPLLAQ
jgi:hypothetical protein